MSLGYTKDSFVPLAPVAKTSFVLVARSELNLVTYESFIQYIIKNPRKFTLGFWHEPTSRVMAKWVDLAGLPKPTITSYNGSTTQLEALAKGEIDFAFETWVAARNVENLRVLAVLDTAGYSAIGKVTVTCLGILYPEINIDNWYGIVAPAGMDPELAAKLQQAISEGLKQEKYQQRLADLDFRIWKGTAEDFTAQQNKTIDFYKKL